MELIRQRCLQSDAYQSLLMLCFHHAALDASRCWGSDHPGNRQTGSESLQRLYGNIPLQRGDRVRRLLFFICSKLFDSLPIQTSLALGPRLEQIKRQRWEIQHVSPWPSEGLQFCRGGSERSRRHHNGDQMHWAGAVWAVGQTRSPRSRWGDEPWPGLWIGILIQIIIGNKWWHFVG